MQTAKNLQMLPMHPSNALLRDRWRSIEDLSYTFSVAALDADIHIWCLASMVPTNPRKRMFVGWGVRRGHDPVVYAFGANETKESLDYVVSKTRDALHLGRNTTFTHDVRRRVSWSSFVSALPQIPIKVADAPYLNASSGPRNVKNMLSYIADLGNLMDETTASAIALLGRADLIRNGMEVVPGVCAHLGRLCRNMEIEGVFWPKRLWLEAIKEYEIFVDSNVPMHYLPDGPQLWYFEEPFTLHRPPPPNDHALSWWGPEWKVSSIALLPADEDGKLLCWTALIFESNDPKRDSPDQMLPRILVIDRVFAGGSCNHGFSLCMAGLEFMNEMVPRTPAEYSAGAKKEAQRSGMKLQPYSIMELRHQQTAPVDTQMADGDTGQKQTYHFSFFQRRHRRRLKVPRKADGVQIIRVAACQKCKHLPLKPNADIKVTKVVR
jgi:hypothetical protein